MYRPDIVSLRQFYASPLGNLAKAALVNAIRARWPELNSDLTLGFGYANPLLRPYLSEEGDKNMLLAPVLPAAQGAVCWPQHTRNRAVLVDEFQLPFANNIINRILLVHALENTADTRLLLDECWRVLCPGGRMLVIAPNRRGLWASSSHTPFSYGHPYSVSQLKETVCAPERFTLIDTGGELYFLPSPRRLLRKLAPVLQLIGKWLFPAFGGAIVMEVEKQVYATMKEPKRRLSPQPAYIPAAKPVMTRD